MTGYVYDAAGIRVAKGSLTSLSCNFASNGYSTTSSYVLGPGGEQVTEYAVSGGASSWLHTNVFAAGQLLATYRDTNTYFALNDWLGTKRVEVAAGAPISCASTFTSLPFGNGFNSAALPGYTACTDATEHHFTGKERDAESGNDYFGARYYASSMGRFLSPDPSQLAYADPTNPQSLNLYSYAYNNPLINIDPSGMECVWDDGSYDAADDPDTGNAAGCSGQGGTYIDPQMFEDVEGNQYGSWSGQASSSIASDWLTPSAIVNGDTSGGPSTSGSSIGSLLHALACSVPGVVGQIAQATGHTVGFGVGGSASAGLWGQGFAINLGVQIVSDTHKNLGIAGTFGVATPFSGVVIGVGAAGGVQASGSNANNISQLAGPAADASGGGGAGLGGTLDVAAGLATNSQGHITGLNGVVTTTATGPFAVGGKGGTVMMTQTGLISTNCSDVW
jgi:RHS repeat-associated protein